MSEIYTATPVIEDITRSLATGVGTGGAFPLPFINGSGWFITFDFGVSVDAEGRGIDPPVTYTNDAEGYYYTLTINTSFTAIANKFIYPYFYTDPNMALPSHPDNNPVVSGDLYDSTWSLTKDGGNPNIANTDPAWTLNSNGTTYDFVWNLDWDAGYDTLQSDNHLFYSAGQDNSATPVGTPLRDTFRDVTWNGRFGVMIYNLFGNNSHEITGASLSGPAIEFHTGKSGSHNSQGRAVHDMKMGMPAFATELQEDGFTEGIWTSTAAFDAKDPMEESPYEPPDTERDREDDYPL